MITWKKNNFVFILAILAIIATACTPKKSKTQSQSPMEGEINMVQIQTPLTDFEIDGTTLVKYIGNETSVVIPDKIGRASCRERV